MSERPMRQTRAEKREELLALRADVEGAMREYYVTTQGLSYGYVAANWTLRGETISRDELVMVMMRDMPEVTERMIKCGVQHLELEAGAVARQTRKQLAETLSGTKGAECDDSELRRWIEAVCGPRRCGLAVEADVWAMKQFLWQVLRHACRLPVSWPIVPVIWSATQGTGKSYLVDRLLEPWAADRLTIEASQLSESFLAPVLSRTLVGVLDDFTGPGDTKQEVGIWKSYITAPKVMRRKMYTDTGFEAANRLSMIATSNLQPASQVNDSTGSRRMWPIQSSSLPMDTDTERAALAAAITSSKIWGSVDVRVPRFNDLVPAEVKAYWRQQRHEECRTKGVVEGWYDDWTVAAEGRDLYMGEEGRDSLNRYAAKHGLRKAKGGDREVGKQLKALGAEVRNTGGLVRLLNRRLIEGEAHEPALRLVKGKRA